MKSVLSGGMWFAAALIATPARAAEPTSVFQCMLIAPLPDGGPRLLVFKSFREDGSVNGMHVSWEDNAVSGLARTSKAGDRVFVRLTWPGEHRIGKPDDRFDWSQGSIEMHLLLENPASFALRPGEEEWRQVVIDRDRSVVTIDRKGARYASVSRINMLLMSDLEATTTSAQMTMSLDSFLAWGAGVPHVTVFETRVRRSTPAKNSYPASPAGARRIIGIYDVDTTEVGRTVAMIRVTTEQWERSLSSSWRTCRRTTEGGDIVINNNKKR